MNHCINCKHWGPPRVIVGSRHVMGDCEKAHPQDAGTYDTSGCKEFDPHNDAKRLRIFRVSVEAQNEALDAMYGKPEPLWFEGVT